MRVETSESWRPREVLAGATLLLAAAAAQRGETIFDLGAMDESADGRVSKEEYMAHVLDMLGEKGSDQKSVRVSMLDFLSRLFDESDISGDEFLQELEVQYARFLFYSVTSCKRMDECEDEFQFGARKASKAFDAFDADSDGKVSWEEYEHAAPEKLGSCGVSAQLLPAMAARSFQAADIVADGALGLKELHFALFLAKERLISKAVWDDLRAMDLNDDAVIDRAEVAAAVAQSRSKTGWGGVVRLVAEHFDQSDANGDGVLDSGEVAQCAEDVREWLFMDC